MPGTKAGGAKARDAILKTHGMDYFSRIGRKGGSVTKVQKGFAANLELAREAGRIGGTISRRRPVKVQEIDEDFSAA